MGSEEKIGEPKLLKFMDDGGANEITMTSDEDFGGLVGKKKVHNSSVTRLLLSNVHCWPSNYINLCNMGTTRMTAIAF